MYHLIVGFGNPDNADSEITIWGSRFLTATDQETHDRYGELKPDAVQEMKKHPVVMMHEGKDSEACIGILKRVRRDDKDLSITVRVISTLDRIPGGEVQECALELGIEPYEFGTSHWSMKNVDLLDVLKANGVISLEQCRQLASELEPNPEPPNISGNGATGFNREQVFIVHGHDDNAKMAAKGFIESLGLDPIILHMQASGGRTIIEKIDYYSNVGYAIVLYTECDVGAKRDSLRYSWRARQNVVFEHGYLIGKLGRDRVAALVKGAIERPNDVSGIVYVEMDAQENWKEEIIREMNAVGYGVAMPGSPIS